MQIEDIEVPNAWAEAVAKLAAGSVRRILVVGPADSGKSTLCRVLFAAARDAGRRPSIIDTDLGQKIVGPPACVTLGAGPERVPELTGFAFVGTTDPVKGWTRLLQGARALVDQAAAELIVINTSGLVRGPGGTLKAEKIRVLEPDLVLTLGGDLDAILPRDGPSVLRLAPAPGARRKTNAERRAARRAAFRDYFQNAEVQVLPIESATNEAGDAWPRGLLVGLAGGGGTDLAMGLIGERVEHGTEILAPVFRGEARHIKPGFLVLDQNFSEMPAPAETGGPERPSP
jgi:polynucleotide 5'-hydroxyl-kinase GRC3/NOL9